MERRLTEAMWHCPLFRGMAKEEIDNLMEHVAQCRVTYSKNEVLVVTDNPCRYADIVIKGELSARMIWKSKREVEVCRLVTGDIISPAFIFADDHGMPVNVVAIEDTEILRLEPLELFKLIDTYPVIRTNYIRILSNIVTYLTRKIKVLVLLSVKEKVARFILDQSKEQETATIRLDKSRQELADSFGIQKNSIIRALSDLVSEGAVDVKGRKITILDDSKLL